ncbi:hypothetical protein RQP46_003183 [Phenoliferia psychrophenolica]
MCYGCLGMLIRALGPQYSRLRPNLYLVVFCLADLVAIVVQAIGGAMAALALEQRKDSKVGTHIMVGGIAFQTFSMIIFCGLFADFFLAARKDASYARNLEGRRVNLFVYGLVFSSFWILVRCIYRTAELAEGFTGYLITTQPYFLVLDSAAMVLAMGVWNVTHPYFCLPDFKSLSEVSEVKEEEETTGAKEFPGMV